MWAGEVQPAAVEPYSTGPIRGWGGARELARVAPTPQADRHMRDIDLVRHTLDLKVTPDKAMYMDDSDKS